LVATIDLGDGNIEDRELVEEMRSSYMDYAMSVIVGRALPDVRDGLKPVHRRVLYTMQDLGLQPNRPYVKCARVVGDCMGKYHPHGDSAIYDTLVRLGQPFASRYPLVDTQGNFGNIDGDPAAAMRYTECRLSPIAVEMLRDLDEDVVDFEPNYDEQNQMPTVMPARFPNLLANGSAGIAVGMATNIPPHNLREIIAGAIALIDNPQITTDELMEHVKGPDFPTGGVVMGLAGIRDAYETGRGRIRVRAVAHIEPQKGGHDAIIITELPYQVRKGGDDGVLAKIAELVHEKVITGIRDIADQSDRSGMRIWIELKRGEMARVVLNQLYKHTPLQTTFGANIVTLVGGAPRTLGLKALLRHYVDHQKEVITRRTKYRLERANSRLHVLEGYLIALDNLDRVIAVIRGSADVEVARETLMSEFGLSETQARAILDLRLRALTALQQDEVRKEHGELVALVEELRAILADEERVYAIVKDELSELGTRFGDDRRTEIVPAEGELDLEQLIREEDMVISITQTGYIKRVAASTYRQQKRGGVGVMGMETKDDDWIEHLLVASTHDYVLFFTSVGKVYRLKVHELPEGNRQGRGRAVVNLLPLREGEHVRTVIATRDFTEGMYLVQATKAGIVKKTLFKEYDTPRKSDGIIAINIREGDELIGVRLTSGEDDVLLTSRKGQTVRFDENEARAMGRATGGVIGMKLRKGDEVIAIDVADDEADLLVVTENGYGKRTRVAEYPRKGRGTMGVLTIRLVEARGAIVRALVVGPRQEILVITESGTVQRTSVDGISQMGRATQGVIVQRLRDGDRISAVAMVDSASVAGNVEPDEPLPLGGLSEIAPEVVPYVSADAAEAAAERAEIDEPAPSALDEIMADTEDEADEAADEDDEEPEE
jgi:DNA gyrase subunit A